MIGRTADIAADGDAVEVEIANEERHVDEIVVVGGREVVLDVVVVVHGRHVHLRQCGHPGRDLPAARGVGDDLGGPIEAAADGIHEQVGAVEEGKGVGAGPGDGAVNGVGEIVEGDGHGASLLDAIELPF